MMVDVLIKNALIVDGTGRRRYHADLGSGSPPREILPSIKFKTAN
jgi:hypothetical protein